MCKIQKKLFKGGSVTHPNSVTSEVGVWPFLKTEEEEKKAV